MSPDDFALPRVETVIKIPFHDVDSMDLVWHGNYARYLEIARCELLDCIDYNYLQMRDSGYAWPVIDMRLRYAGPATFGQQIIVKAELKEWEHRLKVGYTIVDATSGKRLTRASTVQVAVCMKAEEMCLASPPVFVERLLAWQQKQ
ncbi:acyl-CoA thioesterase [Granulosicoccus antarcticus]|uniref:Esterase n=1 Tax=Granulosicoccus antarcticus IMCC3135 TaxID=1192854 RepID=A0A2Z2PAF5_9GAMM|nr:thioesterase family protein [Granulosicoccus antarcticus]ASJ76854.1 Putative esterase [Granulosicoccus antarcticus IMCC3135]